MNIGTVLVLVGVICAVLEIFTKSPFKGASLLTIGVILIGLGVLFGPTPLFNT